jgi:hypothetical protein
VEMLREKFDHVQQGTLRCLCLLHHNCFAVCRVGEQDICVTDPIQGIKHIFVEQSQFRNNLKDLLGQEKARSTLLLFLWFFFFFFF